MGSFLGWLDLAGVFVFAISGALTASRKELDIVGFMVVAAVTGIGGGTLRDVLLDVGPVYWISRPIYIYVTTAAAVLVFFTAHLVESRYRLLLWADAIGLALFCVTGTEVAIRAGAPPAVAILMGTMTATFGGLLRDVICNETPIVMRREIYLTAAAIGAAAVVSLELLGLPHPVPAVAGFALALAIRSAALLLDLSLPAYRPRPGRSY